MPCQRFYKKTNPCPEADELHVHVIGLSINGKGMQAKDRGRVLAAVAAPLLAPSCSPFMQAEELAPISPSSSAATSHQEAPIQVRPAKVSSGPNTP